MKSIRKADSIPRLLAVLASLAIALPAFAEPPPAALSGGACTQFNDGREAFALPLANATRETKRAFVVGNSFFNENWVIAPASTVARDGLGPLFQARSCSSCHIRDGRGAPPKEGETMTGLLLRLSIPGRDEHGGPLPDPIYGLQLAVRAIPGAEPEAEALIKWETTSGAFSDGETYQLRRPTIHLSKWVYGAPSDKLLISPRLAPPNFGGGLLESIPEKAILALADPDDANNDGISGRPNKVWDVAAKRHTLGRIGWKANQPHDRQQAADALLADIGLRTSLHPSGDFTAAQESALAKFADGGQPEVSDHIFDRIVTYLQALAPPARRKVGDPITAKGEKLFHQLNCAACHVPEWKTDASSSLTELHNQIIRPYTDLLLHDMGEGLADNRPDFEATGREWRTAPLWGLGLNAIVNGNAFFLHDGRARNITEAILWHEGEANKSTEAFKALNKEDRAALLEFLNAL